MDFSINYMKQIILFFLFIPLFNYSQSSDVINLAYGKSNQQVLDLYLPKENISEAPVVIMLHGGAWSIGGLEYSAKHSHDLRNLGLVVANVDYRYVSDTIAAKDLLQDINSAIAFISKNAEKYGYAKSGYHIIGISAGGHLALLYGYANNMKSIAALCAPSRLDNPEVFDFMKNKEHLKIIERLAGTKFEENASNTAFAAISPFKNISNVPTLLIHGDADTLVNVSLSQSLYSELQYKKVESKLLIRTGKGHDVGMNSPDTEIQNILDVFNWIKQHND